MVFLDSRTCLQESGAPSNLRKGGGRFLCSSTNRTSWNSPSHSNALMVKRREWPKTAYGAIPSITSCPHSRVLTYSMLCGLSSAESETGERNSAARGTGGSESRKFARVYDLEVIVKVSFIHPSMNDCCFVRCLVHSIPCISNSASFVRPCEDGTAIPDLFLGIVQGVFHPSSNCRGVVSLSEWKRNSCMHRDGTSRLACLFPNFGVVDIV
ncbi:hypothetical protein BKA61DRAFT_179237 [Leptodontidium sp. MPI-SDFR-AT-0119]|nr:hypothetical protein BKA61DRAFT_179237 [Leptodontidium sp. MPI-SDFR-AT-0119]